VFYLHIPLAALVLIATPALMPASGALQILDIAGALTVTVGLAAAVSAIVRTPETGWNTTPALDRLAGVAVLLPPLVIRARQREPPIRLSVFATRNLSVADIAELLPGAAWIPMWFYLNLQQALRNSALPAVRRRCR
jgi:hypothetical protein